MSRKAGRKAGRGGRRQAIKQIRQERGRQESKEGGKIEGGKERNRHKEREGGRKKSQESVINILTGRRGMFKLTNESRLCQLKGFGCVQAGKGDQMKTSVHGVVHSHHTNIPVMIVRAHCNQHTRN